MNRVGMQAFTPRMQQITEFFRDLGTFKFVGGCVRDLLTETEPKDYDLITPVLPDDVEAYIKSKGRRAYNVGKRFGTVGVKLDGQLVEITTYRGEDYSVVFCPDCQVFTPKQKCEQCGKDLRANSRKPVVKYTDQLQEDLQRRDFTINAMAIDPYTGKIHDPFDGEKDLDERIIRTVGNPKIRFKEDPLRVLRAVRFAARYGALFEGTTLEKVVSCRWELLRISKERIVSEINAMFKLQPEAVGNALSMMWSLQLWQVIMPALQLQHWFNQKTVHHRRVLHLHSLGAVKSVREMYSDAIVNGEQYTMARMWAALLHDVAKPFTQRPKKNDPMHCNYIDHDRLGAMMADEWLQYFKFSNEDREFIVDTIQHHLEDGNWLRPHDNGAKD